VRFITALFARRRALLYASLFALAISAELFVDAKVRRIASTSSISSSVTLAWDAPSPPPTPSPSPVTPTPTPAPVLSYNLYIATATQPVFAVIDVVLAPTTTATINNLTPGITYAFVVTVNYADGTESGPSNEVQWPPPPVHTAVVSRLYHAGIPYDVDIGNYDECRLSGNGLYSVIFTFTNPITSCGTPINAGASVSPGPNANQCTEIVPLTNASNTLVGMNDITDSTGLNGTAATHFELLIGDVLHAGKVNSSSIAAIQSKSGTLVDPTTFRFDVTVNGEINSSDIAVVQSKSGTALP
jgi:hypothetical protein